MNKRISQELILKEGLSVIHLLRYIGQSDTVRLAIIEATHRFYHDLAFNPYTERPYAGRAFEMISNIHSTQLQSNPSWRSEIKLLGERYANPEPATECYLFNRPETLLDITLKTSLV